MKRVLMAACCLLLPAALAAQSVRTWTSNSNQNWSRSANWSGNNPPSASNEIAQFGTGNQLAPELNRNGYTVRGIRFSAAADGYDVGDDNGARTLEIGNWTSGFIENLSASDQVISIATLEFRSDSIIRTTDTGGLTLSSNLTGTNRDLVFRTVGAISAVGNITTGAGTLTKQGAGSLFLSGANTYTGTTTISAGAIVLQAAGVFADTGRVDIAGGARLDLQGFSEQIAFLTGAGTVDFGSGGTLTLGAGSSEFSGDFAGAGTLVIGAGASLTLGADFNNSDINVILAGGTLRLGGHALSVGGLSVTDDSIIDFGFGSEYSVLSVASVGFGAASVGLTVQNWADAADYFYSQTGYVQGAAPLNQIEFVGWDTADTKWQGYDQQITPVPEPAVYGALLLGVLTFFGWWRRRG